MDSKYNPKIIRSRRKSIQIEITSDCKLVVRVPLYMKNDEIEKFLLDKEHWIDNHLKKAVRRAEERGNEPLLYAKDIRELTLKARKLIPERVRYYAEIAGISYGKITIKNQKSRWGSCSAKGNLNFNCLLMLTPDDVIDYVVVHELSHRVYMNHSKDFWKQVESILPGYKKSERWLKENGNRLIERVHERENE